MPLKVAMYDKSYDHIAPNLDALGLDIDVCTLRNDCTFLVCDAPVAPRDLDIDYFWLSSHISADGFRDKAFDSVLACKSVGVLQTFNAGLDHPFYKQLSAQGTRICNSSAQGVAIAEYVMAQVLSVLHPIELQRQLQAEKQWRLTPFREVSQTKWLIIGYGPIGQQLTKRVKAFGARIAVIRRSQVPSDSVDQVGTMTDLGALAHDADVVVVACSLNNQTKGFANEAFFASLKEGAIVVNIARGALIDDSALRNALDSGRLGTAILDVFSKEPLPVDDPLWSHPKVRLTSHTSFAGSGGRARWDQLFLDNIVRFAKGETLLCEVNPSDIV